MSSTEIIEKVATYKDEQVIIHNQVNKIDAIEQNTIKADFFLVILGIFSKCPPKIKWHMK